MEDNLNSVGEKTQTPLGEIVDLSAPMDVIQQPEMDKTEYDIGTVLTQEPKIDAFNIYNNVADSAYMDNGKFAESVKIAKETGENPFDIYENFADKKKELSLSAVDIQRIKDDNPVLYRHLQHSEFAGMTSDQIPKLSSLEYLMYRAGRVKEGVTNFVTSVGNEYNTYDKLVEVGNSLLPNLFERNGLSKLTDEQRELINEYHNTSSVFNTDNSTILGDAVRGVAGQVPILVDTLSNASLPVAATVGAGAALSVAFPEAIPVISSGVRSLAGVEFRAGLLKTSFSIESASTALDLMRMNEQQGLGIDNETIRVASIGVGAVSALLEQAPLSMIAGTIKTALKGGRISKLVLKKALRNKKLMNKLLELGANVAKVGVVEGITEVAQEITHIIGETVAINTKDGSMTDVPVDKILSALTDDESVKRMRDSFYGAAVTSLGFGLAGVPAIVMDSAKVRSDAVKDNEILNQVRDSVSDIPLRETNPEAFKGFAQEAGMKDEYVYIDADAINDYVESIDGGKDDVAFNMLKDAVEITPINEDVKIPLAEYATYIANTDHDKVLSPHMRLTEEGISLAKENEYKLATEKQLKKILEREARNFSDTEKVQYDEVMSQMKSQLDRVGYPSRHAGIMSSIYANYVARVSRATGKSIKEVSDKLGLRIESDIKDRKDEIDQLGISPKQDFGDAEITDTRVNEKGEVIKITRSVNDMWREVMDRADIIKTLTNCVRGE